jgi:hypothetical protein
MTGFGALELLARAGFLVKGVVYIVVALALQVAAHPGGRVTGTGGAFATVLAQPFGRTLLLVAAVGLLALRCLAPPPGFLRSRPLRARLARPRTPCTLRRARDRARGAGPAGIPRLSRAGGSVRNQRARGCHRSVAWPLGDWLVVLTGLGLIAFAVQQIYAAITCRLERAPRKDVRWPLRLSSAG